jgi:hypothetical protein
VGLEVAGYFVNYFLRGVSSKIVGVIVEDLSRALVSKGILKSVPREMDKTFSGQRGEVLVKLSTAFNMHFWSPRRKNNGEVWTPRVGSNSFSRSLANNSARRD